MVDLGNGLIIQLAVYLVVEVCSLGKEVVTLLLLNMVVKTVMVHDEKIALAMKTNAQVAPQFFVFVRTYMSCLVISLENSVIIVTLIRPD